MKKQSKIERSGVERPKREKVTREESLKRVNEFPKRMEKLVRSISDGLFERPKKVKLTREEIIERMESFPNRMEKFIAAVRKNTDRGLHS